MHRDRRSRLLKILLVTEDRALQRQLTQFFNTVGYHVLQAADAHSALAAVEAEMPQILLIGSDLAARGDWELCRLLIQRQPPSGLFKFLMVEEPSERQLQEALEAGIDDVLLKPIGFGELLSRLRAAARLLEFDRRVCQQQQIDAVTGLMSRSAIVTQLRRQLTEFVGPAPHVACVVFDIDYFGRVSRLQGSPASQTLLRAVANELNNLRMGAETLGSLGSDRFCAILPEANDATAADWANCVREALAAAQFKLGDTSWQITASFGVAGCEGADSAEELIEQATQALQTAKSSGRNCVVRCREFGSDTRELIPHGKLLEGTVAGDVMIPCAVFVQPNESIGEVVDLFHQTRLEGIPVVDGDGKLLGLCEQANVIAVPESQHATRVVRDVMTTDIPTFGEREGLTVLMDFFNRDPRSLVIVAREGRPVGFVTCNCLVALSRPVTSGSLAAESKYCDTTEYLLVPDIRPLECEPTP